MDQDIVALQKAMALIIAEHEAMRSRLMELEEITLDLPICWASSGEPIVDLEEAIRKHFTKG